MSNILEICLSDASSKFPRLRARRLPENEESRFSSYPVGNALSFARESVLVHPRLTAQENGNYNRTGTFSYNIKRINITPKCLLRLLKTNNFRKELFIT